MNQKLIPDLITGCTEIVLWALTPTPHFSDDGLLQVYDVLIERVRKLENVATTRIWVFCLFEEHKILHKPLPMK